MITESRGTYTCSLLFYHGIATATPEVGKGSGADLRGVQPAPGTVPPGALVGCVQVAVVQCWQAYTPKNISEKIGWLLLLTLNLSLHLAWHAA